MKYPIYKKNALAKEFYCILDANTMASIQNAPSIVSAIGVVEHKETIDKKLTLPDSTKEEFSEALVVVRKKLDRIIKHPNLQ